MSVTPKPRWLKVPAPTSPAYLATRRVVEAHGIGTVCREANCPNIGRCWAEGSAAFMILGTLCTRNCAFCDVTTGRPGAVDQGEPARLARAVAEMGLSHVVITSVCRDDLPDGGAGQFAACIEAIRAVDARVVVEVLVPDFRGKTGALAQVVAAQPGVFNHNIETVPRLYGKVRPAADYSESIALLAQAGRMGMVTKSGLLLGLGEETAEVFRVFHDLRTAEVSMLTMGQYLAPSPGHHPVARYVPPETFEELRQEALAMGFSKVASGPLVRSSLHAKELHGEQGRQ